MNKSEQAQPKLGQEPIKYEYAKDPFKQEYETGQTPFDLLEPHVFAKEMLKKAVRKIAIDFAIWMNNNGWEVNSFATYKNKHSKEIKTIEYLYDSYSKL